MANVAAVAVDEPHMTPNAAEPPIVAYASPPRRCPRTRGNRVIDLRGKAGRRRERPHQEEQRHGREIDVGEHADRLGREDRQRGSPARLQGEPDHARRSSSQSRSEFARGSAAAGRARPKPPIARGVIGRTRLATSRDQHDRLDQDRAPQNGVDAEPERRDRDLQHERRFMRARHLGGEQPDLPGDGRPAPARRPLRR